MIAKKLKPGDTVGIICPAGPEEIDIIKKHIYILENMGFNIKEGIHLYDKYGYFAGTDQDRAKDFMHMFTDDEVDAVMCYRGGYGTMRLLNLIDFKVVKKHPKIFIGYSDITTLLNHISQRYGLITFHGPMAGSNLEDELTLKSFRHTLMNGTKPYIIDSSGETELILKGTHSTEGILAGGNLSLICSTLGTPYEIDTKDKILFIEEVGELPYRIDRMLTQLLLAGKLQKCRGFILGQFTDCSAVDSGKSLTLEQVISDRILNLNKPTIVNFLSGHDYPKLTLPIGARIKINCHCNRIEVLEAVVE